MKPTRLTFAIALATLVAACSGGPGESGALIAPIDPSGETVGFLDFSNGSQKTFGLFVCAQDAAVTLDSVESLEIEGDALVIGARVLKSDGGFVGAADEFPPTSVNPTLLTDVGGVTVDTPCTGEAGPRTQLLIGTERTSAGGGVIHGVRVNHNEGYLSVPAFTIILCGDEYEYCESIRPEE